MAARTNNKTPLGRFILKTLYLKGKNQAWLAEQSKRQIKQCIEK